MIQGREEEVEEKKPRNHDRFFVTGDRWTRLFRSFSDIKYAFPQGYNF
jgi:hypothetical protein